MPGIAPTRANAPRTASAVLFFWAPGKPAAQRCAAWCGLPVVCLLACLLGGGLPWPALAQDTIYRCGREYTNTPNDPVRCERLADQAVTVISGVRPAAPEPSVRLPVASGGLVSNGPRTPPEVSRTPPEQQVERDQLARSVLAQELVRARQLQASLLGEYRQGDPVRSAAEVQSPPKYQERVASLKAAIERTERDIDSLQRELARRPLAAKTPSP